MNIDEIYEAVKNETCIRSYKIEKEKSDDLTIFDSKFGEFHPRYNAYSKYDTLLLQIDSDDDIMWGDTGVANFFINSDDLIKRDFSNILYNWDCC